MAHNRPKRPAFLPPEGEAHLALDGYTIKVRCDIIPSTYPNLAPGDDGEPPADVLFDATITLDNGGGNRATHVIPLNVLKESNIPETYIRSILSRLTHALVHSLAAPIEGALEDWAGLDPDE
jgi:hypothetical protein